MSWVYEFVQAGTAPSYSRSTNAKREALIGKDLAMTIDTKTTK
ncbi:hypothetical protein BAMY6614_05130 [Bacillus amyloliquefaciens UMAF6614]|nr:hypothetical protein BAMY6614_05130 [Bacillus amyloliquefaciens UMAF6614]